MSKPLRYFVTATDTGVGKTQVSCALLRLMATAGLRPFAFKPYESGVDERMGPADAVALQRAAGSWQPLDQVNLASLAAPLAPGVAARALAPAQHRRHQQVWGRATKALSQLRRASGVVEGAGGLRVPLDDTHEVLDLIAISRMSAVVVARAGLGTLNHTRLTLDALERRRVPVAAVVLVHSARRADPSAATNPAELRRGAPHLLVLGPVPYVARPAARARAFDQALRSLVE